MARFDPDDAFTPDALAMLEDLRRRSWRELVELPRYQELTLTREGRSGTVSTWRDLLPDEQVRVVVQIHVPWRLGISKVAADGFVMTMSGQISAVADEDLYEFT